MRYGSLFTGYGGLDLAVEAVTGAQPAWVSDNAKHAVAIETHHWPDVPNLGDITTVDWKTVEPVDVLTGGFPCQDVSYAGRRAGMKAGNRSGLWSTMATAIDVLRPSLVVIENVRGLLSANAHADLEPCPWCVGDGPKKPALRALGAVLGDLADLGYDAAWHGLTAASVGAPHRRYRIFVVAWPAHADGSGLEVGGLDVGDADPERPAAGRGDPAAADAFGGVGDGRAEVPLGRPVGGTPAGRDRAVAVGVAAGTGHVAADALGGEFQRRGGSGGVAREAGAAEGDRRETATGWAPRCRSRSPCCRRRRPRTRRAAGCRPRLVAHARVDPSGRSRWRPPSRTSCCRRRRRSSRTRGRIWPGRPGRARAGTT